MYSITSFRNFCPMVGALTSLAILCSSNAFAQQSVDESLQAEKGSYVEIEHINGEAEIIGWDKDEVRVTGTLGERTEEFIFERKGRDIIIEIEVKKSGKKWGWGSDEGDDLKIYVPQESRIGYTSVNADVDISDIQGNVKVDVVNGSIQLDKITGDARLESVNGDIRFDNLVGELVVETVNGGIRGKGRETEELSLNSVNGSIDVVSDAEDVTIETVNGDVDVELESIQDFDVETVNGSVSASMNLQSNGDVRASSVGGSITLAFQDDVSARFDIEAHAGGRIVNRISADKMMKAKYGPRRWLEFSHNGGKARVEVSTVSGRVTLENN